MDRIPSRNTFCFCVGASGELHFRFLQGSRLSSLECSGRLRFEPCRRGRGRCRQPQAAFEPIWEDPAPELIVTKDAELAQQVTISRMVLQFQDEIGEADARSLLCEYARQTCAEEGVLRCDVLKLSSNNTGSNANDNQAPAQYTVWTIFTNAMARAQHEQTSHTNKLRILLAKSSNHADNAVELAKLVNNAELYEMSWPYALNGWKSSTDYALPKASAVVGAGDPTAPLRQALNILLENVGLEDAVVLVATAHVSEDYYEEDAKKVCAQYAQSILQFDEEVTNTDGITRVGVLSTVGDRTKITVIQVHDKNHPNGALFDMELATEMLDENGWHVDRFVSVFPDLAGWRMLDIYDKPWNIPGKPEVDFRTGSGEPGTRLTIEEAYRLQQEEVAREGGNNSSEEESYAQDELLVESEQKLEESGKNDAKASDAVVDANAVDVGHASLQEYSSDQEATNSSETQRIQLVSGNGAFTNIEAKMRQLCGKKSGVLRVFAVSGWNEARLQPLVMEMDEGVDAGRIDFNIGANVFGASATISKVAAGVSTARMHEADIIVGFGGGAVMDTAKSIAALVKMSPNDVSKVLSAVHDAASNGNMALEVKLGHASAPLMLIAGTTGSGVEVAEQAILNASLKNGNNFKRIAVVFNNAKHGSQMAIADPRLVIPRRFNSRDAAMGGLQALCFALDASLCPHAPEQAIKLAFRALRLGSTSIIRARREPESSDGPARDMLVECSTYAGLAREACGGVGLATCISLSLLDGAEPTTCGLDGPLRIVLPRVTAAMISASTPAMKKRAAIVAQLILRRDDADSDDLVRWLLMTAEDIGVSLLDFIGVYAKDAERAANAVVEGKLVSSCVDSELVNVNSIVAIITAAASQEFEL